MRLDILTNYKESDKFSFKFFLPILIYFLLYFLFFLPTSARIISYAIVYISTSVGFIFLWRYLLTRNINMNYLYIMITIAIVIRIGVLFVHPTGSDDYYRYLWDGKVIANGINPYQYAPSDKALDSLHSETLPLLVSFKDIKTIYPPLSLGMFYLSYIIGGETFYGIKILLLLFELFTFLGIFLILKERNLPLKNIFLYALAPLPIFQFFVDSHIDVIGLTLLIFSIYFYLSHKKEWSLIFVGLSICVKPVGLILIPILFITEKGIRAKIRTVLIPFIVCFLLYLPFILSIPLSEVFNALTNYTVNWTFNGFVFDIINSFLNDNQKARLICGILFVLAFIPVLFSRKDFMDKIYLSVFLLLIFSPIVHPWYVTWLAVLLPLVPRWSGILYANLVCLTAFTVVNYQLHGIWKDYPAVLLFEYVPVIIFFFYELYFQKNKNILQNLQSD